MSLPKFCNIKTTNRHSNSLMITISFDAVYFQVTHITTQFVLSLWCLCSNRWILPALTVRLSSFASFACGENMRIETSLRLRRTGGLPKDNGQAKAKTKVLLPASFLLLLLLFFFFFFFLFSPPRDITVKLREWSAAKIVKTRGFNCHSFRRYLWLLCAVSV